MSVVEKSGLWASDIEILRLHYAKTLELWRERFQARRAELAKLYDERFCRMFEFYLIGSELAFRRMGHMNWQIQLSKDVATVPLARDYMGEMERRKLNAVAQASRIPLEQSAIGENGLVSAMQV
ncbi:Methoxy mycolic acid synthase MmaA3 [compost metagenome]